ncbi:GntR family transcriptional regulator [Nocardia alni]|uniref:GntR family transcriptional regulator n=1 Tax=Nocardia alni TaxID=2815723 RepID=UPI001C224CFD|nr:GntR family transcriptional regulator [Nocardia alni]
MTRLTLTGQRRGLRELAYESIRDALITLRIAPGERITEEGLSEELGVSRPILREALQRLQVEQLVDRLDNGRMRARPVSADDVRHLYAVRSALEQLAVREAGARLTDPLRMELTTVVGQMRSATKVSDVPAVTELGDRFHRQLAAIAANPVNDQLMEQIRGPIDRFRHLSVTVASRPKDSTAEHEAVLAALLAGDLETAAAAMDRHIVSGRDAVLLALDEQHRTR